MKIFLLNCRPIFFNKQNLLRMQFKVFLDAGSDRYNCVLIDEKRMIHIYIFIQEKLRTFARERQLRLQAEKERDEIERKFLEYQEQMKQIHDTLVCLFSKIIF